MTAFSPLVVWHDVECGRYAADLPVWRELAAAAGGPVLDVGAGTGRVALDLARHGARVVALDRRFPLVIVPMQTVQLLPDRAAFLACVRAHLAPSGLLAIAITAALEDFGELPGELPAPDVGNVDAYCFASQPTAVRALPGATRIERLRRTLAPDGTVTEEEDVIELAHLTVTGLEAEGRAAGLVAERARSIAETPEHVGSEVVMLRA